MTVHEKAFIIVKPRHTIYEVDTKQSLKIK